MQAAQLTIKMPGLHSVPLSTPKKDLARMEVMEITPEGLSEWKLPGMQRPLIRTKRTEEAAAEMQQEAAKNKDASATITGVITLGKIGRDTFLIDGQHRLYGAFLLACRELLVHGGVLVKRALVDVSLRTFEDDAEMAREFIRLNSQLNPTKPDDVMRALAFASPHLQRIEKALPFIGYDLTRENKKTKMLSMSSAIRTWFGSGGIVPAPGPTAPEIVNKYLDEQHTDKLIEFYNMCVEAGWNHESFRRLWSALNLGIVMWIYRRVVLGETMRYGAGGHAPMVLTREQFIVCLRTLMEPKYMEDLVGHSLRYQDRVPCYTRIKEHFTPALKDMGIEAPRFPMAQWT